MYHEQLVTHILSQKKEGHGDFKIRADLEEDGWSKEDIDLAFYYADNPKELQTFSLRKLLHSEVKETTFLFVILLGILSSLYLFLTPKETVVTYEIIAPAGTETKEPQFTYGSQSLLSNPDFFTKIKNQLEEKKTTFVEVNLSQMIARVHKDGKIVVEVPVKTKGKEGSWWETPAGLYRIETKERSHYSSMGHVSQPWSMQFQGNFFIHGWPTYDDGTPVSSTFSGGCIRLTDENAKKIFDEVTVGTPILVYEKDFIPDAYTYKEITPDVTGSSFMAADLLNNYIFYEKNRTSTISAGIITKLMTALVATEYINIEKSTVVKSSALVQTQVPRLSDGMKISVYQLLFPLLRESSNEAAEAIATLYGRNNFIKKMNEKAKSIGMNNTTFIDPTGVSPKNISTVEDVFMLAKYIYNNRSFLFGITSGKIKTTTYGESVFSDLGASNELSSTKNFFGGVSETSTTNQTSNLAILTIYTGDAPRPIFFFSRDSQNAKKDILNAMNFLEEKYK